MAAKWRNAAALIFPAGLALLAETRVGMWTGAALGRSGGVTVRRATIPTVRMEESIRFYQQVLGLNVFFDGVVTAGPVLGFDRPVTVRMVILQSGSNTSGMVGLMEYLEPRIAVPALTKEQGKPYQLVLVFAVHNLEVLHQRALRFGSTVTAPPNDWDIPGKGPGRKMRCLDPNGVLIGLSEHPVGGNPLASVGPLRRATIAVASGHMEQSVSFYRELLGMRAYYDDVVTGSAAISGLGMGDYRARVVSLQQGEDEAGMVGLMEYLEPRTEIIPLPREPGGSFAAFFVFAERDVRAAYDRALLLGAPIICQPVEFEIPGRGMTTEMSCLDPHGIAVNIILKKA